MSTTGSMDGGSRRNRRADPALIAAQLAQQQAHDEDASEATPAPVVPTIVQYPPKPLKIHVPDTYAGERGKLKAFLCQLDLFFGFNADRFPTDKDRVLFATTYMRGPAFEWIEVFLTDFMKNKDQASLAQQETKEIFGFYDKFQEKIKRVFGDVEEKRNAERRLESLVQSTSAAHYASEFQQYAGRVDWNEPALIKEFYKGLKERVKDEIAKDERDTDLQDLINRAIRIDNRQHERKLEKKGEYRTHSSKQDNKVNTKSTYYGPMPMELDATRHKGKLSQKDRDHRMRNKLCLYCGKPGHQAKDCRAKRGQQKHAQATQPVKKGRKPKAQLNATGAIWTPLESSNVNWTSEESVRDPSDKSDTRHPEHAVMSWTACHNDSCFIHLSEKEGSGWFPQERRSKKSKPQVWLNATSEIDSPTCDNDTESWNNSDSDKRSVCTEDQEFLNDSDTLLETNNDEIPDWYPGHQFYGIVKERPPPGSKFTLDGGFVTPNGGYIPRELRKRVYELQCEYRRRDPELDESMKVKPEEFNYYPSEEQKERWHDAVPYFEKASAFYETQAQVKRAQEYI